MRLGGWLESYRAMAAVLLLAVALLAVAGSTVEARLPYVLSTSPENDFVTGASSFRLALEDAGYHVVLVTSVEQLEQLASRSSCLAYMVIGPDKPFNESDALIVRELYRKGKMSLLVADETGITSGLLSLLGAPVPGSFVAVRGLAGSESPLIVPVKCLGSIAASSKVATLQAPPGGWDGWRIVCWVFNGETWMPMAAIKEHAGVRLLVVGDSSIFANFEFNGLYGFTPTRSIALSLARLVAGPGCIVAIDNAHYFSARIRVGRAALMLGRLALTLPSIVTSNILTSHPAASLAATLAVPLLVALYLLGAPWSPREGLAAGEEREYARVTRELLADLELAVSAIEREAERRR